MRTIIAQVVYVGLILCSTGCFSPEPEAEVVEQEDSQEEVQDELEELEREDEDPWTFEVLPSEFIEQLPSEVGGFDIPEDIESLPTFEPTTEDELPEYFDWRDEGVVSSIKDQGDCGACWAFAVASIAESAYAIQSSVEVDVSEQWLVSCNVHGWGCKGGLLALSYFVDQPDSCGGIGAVVESQSPYLGSNSTCNCMETRQKTIPGWAVISSPASVANPDQIKRAIKENGPIVATINADIAFACYSKGIFNRRLVFGLPNHLVVITGWDDRLGSNGIWFLRNSYGPMWGEIGTMRIEYGAASVALFAAGFNSSAASTTESSQLNGSNKNNQTGPESTSGNQSDEASSNKPAGDESTISGGEKNDTTNGMSEGLLDELAILDNRLDYLDDALDGNADGVLPQTPAGATVDSKELEIDPNIIKPKDYGVFGIWKQVKGSNSADVAPGGYQKSYLIISPSGLLEFVRYYGTKGSFETATRLDWRIGESKFIIGEDKELRTDRMKKNLKLQIDSTSVTVTAPTSRLPKELQWALDDGDKLQIGTKFYKLIKR